MLEPLLGALLHFSPRGLLWCFVVCSPPSLRIGGAVAPSRPQAARSENYWSRRGIGRGPRQGPANKNTIRERTPQMFVSHQHSYCGRARPLMAVLLGVGGLIISSPQGVVNCLSMPFFLFGRTFHFSQLSALRIFYLIAKIRARDFCSAEGKEIEQDCARRTNPVVRIPGKGTFYSQAGRGVRAFPGGALKAAIAARGGGSHAGGGAFDGIARASRRPPGLPRTPHPPVRMYSLHDPVRPPSFRNPIASDWHEMFVSGTASGNRERTHTGNNCCCVARLYAARNI